MEDLHVQEKQNGWEYGRIREKDAALETNADRIAGLEMQLKCFSDGTKNE